MSDIQRDIEQIRKAIYGKDVRESIAHGIETCYAEMKQSVNIGAIITGATGEEITLTDSAEAPLQSLKVYGKSTQTRTSGKQLFNATLQSGTFNGISYTRNSDGTYLLKGTATDTAGLQFGRCDFTNGVTYRLVGFQGTGIKDQFALYVNGLGYPNDIGNGITFTANSTGNYSISIAIPTGTTVNMLLKPMLTTDSSATYDDYEPYTGGIPAPNPDYPQPISDVDNAEVTVRGRNLWLLASGYTGSNMSSAFNKQNFNLPKGSYVFSFVGTTTSGSALDLFNSNGNRIVNLYIGTQTLNSKHFFTFDITEDAEMIQMYGGGDVSISEIQLEKGDTTHDYESYKAPQTATIPYTLRGIGNVKDELLVNADGTGKLITRFGVVIADGNINVTGSNIATDRCRLFFEAPNVLPFNDVNNIDTNILCDKLPQSSNEETNTGRMGVLRRANGSSQICISIGANESITTLEQFKSYLESNNMTIIYPLATPIEANLTSEEVAQILTLHTYKPTSIISNDKQAEMEVKYIADTKAYVDAHSGGGSAEKQVKVKTYTGNGNTTNTITFDEQPKMILGWSGRGEGYTMSFVPFTFGEEYPNGMYRTTGSSQSGLEVTASYSGNSITLSAPNSMSAFNGNGGEYNIVYM